MEFNEPTSIISTFLDGTLIGEVAKEQSILCEFPLETANLITLGLVSHIVNMAFCSQISHHRPLPCGLYVASDQGKASSKSPLFDAIKGDVDDYISEWNKSVLKEKKEAMAEYKSRTDWKESGAPQKIVEDMARNPVHMFITNTTPEALEITASKQGGLFSVASTEKTILSTMFTDMYKDNGSANIELPLSGFVGEMPKVLRAGRDGIMSRASGAITVVSQPGTVEKIIESSSNTGLGERFLMLIEPRITIQELEKIWGSKKPTNQPYTKTLYAVLRKIVDFAKRQSSMEIASRRALSFTQESVKYLEEYRRACKLKTLDVNDVFSNELMVGYMLKGDLQVMKIATVLHVVENLINDRDVPNLIDQKYIEIAHCCVFELIRGVAKIGLAAGYIGIDGLSGIIVSYLQGKGKRTADAIYNVVRKREQFAAIPASNRKQEFHDALQKSVSNGLVVRTGGINPQDQKPVEVFSAVR